MKKLIELILENRSLAENDPLNLLRFPDLKAYYDIMGKEKFISDIQSVLDSNE